MQVKISDFGLSTIYDEAKSELTVVGTPLYQSPQMLQRKWYTGSVDTWALGCICYELLVGVTPFHSSNMKDLMRKINDGRYKLCDGYDEPVYVETCLFLLDCLQLVEENRLAVEALTSSPFISSEFANFPLHILDKRAFLQLQQNAELATNDNNNYSSLGSAMLSRFEEDELKVDSDVVLTAKRSPQKAMLLAQLRGCTDLHTAQLDFGASPYFNRHQGVDEIRE